MPFAPINQQEIYYEDIGEGPPLIFMHGFLFDTKLFEHQVNAFHSNYRCIAWDARGFGRTRWDGKPFNLYDSSTDCLKLMDYLKIPSAILVGMSQGGFVAMRSAIQAPQRVRGLVLISTRAGVDSDFVKTQHRELRDLWCSEGPADPILEGYALKLMGQRLDRETRPESQIWMKKWKKLSKQTIALTMNNIIDRDDITSSLPRIAVPSLVIHGELDHGMAWEFGKDLADRLPNCKEFVLVEGAAHAVNLTHPRPVNEAISRFLKSFDLKTPYRIKTGELQTDSDLNHK